jgi:hypothetical protein
MHVITTPEALNGWPKIAPNYKNMQKPAAVIFIEYFDG